MYTKNGPAFFTLSETFLYSTAYYRQTQSEKLAFLDVVVNLGENIIQNS